MEKGYFRFQFLNSDVDEYWREVGRHTFIYPMEPYLGLTPYTENAYKSRLIRKYECSYEEARDMFFRHLESRKYNMIASECRLGYNDAMEMMEYEAINKIEIPVRMI